MKKAVKIQKYKARIAGTGEEVIGYIAEGHKHLHSTSSHDAEDIKQYVAKWMATNLALLLKIRMVMLFIRLDILPLTC